MEKAIITGATGFIGSLLVNTLVKNNIEVIALGRKSEKDIDPMRLELIKGAQYIQLDMNEISKLPECLQKIGWVAGRSCVFYNFAWGGISKLSDLNIDAQYKNIEWSVNALLSAEQLKCKKFIHVGTMEEAFTRAYLKLDYNKNNQYNRHVIYSLAKIASKDFLKLLSPQLKINLIFARNSHVMGPNDDKDSFLQVTLQKLISGDDLIFSSGEQIFDVISVSDCAKAYYLIGEKGKPNRDYWIGSGEPRKLKEYVKVMANLYPSKNQLRFGELPYNDISLEKKDFSIDLLSKDTGFTKTQSFEDTVIELYSWLKNL